MSGASNESAPGGLRLGNRFCSWIRNVILSKAVYDESNAVWSDEESDVFWIFICMCVCGVRV